MVLRIGIFERKIDIGKLQQILRKCRLQNNGGISEDYQAIYQ